LKQIPTNAGLFALLSMLSLPALADTVAARCDLYPKGEDRAISTGPCDFSQRQGSVSIHWPDGKRYELTPDNNTSGNYRDQDGKTAYRQSGLGRDGLIFRMATESVYVYWDASTVEAMNNRGVPSVTAPYSTADYDATSLLPCSFGESAARTDCPAGVLRGDADSASIHIMKPDGEERVLNFADGRFSTPDGGHVQASEREGDWDVRIGAQESYRLPEAFIFGG